MMNKDMKKFLKRCFWFSLPFILYLLFAPILLPKVLAQVSGPSTEEQILFSTKNAILKDYDLLILGNSRLYRGLNPDKFSVPAYNYAHDNDNYNQLFYKLQLLEKRGKSFDKLIISLDYFQFSFISDTRNYVYEKIFGTDYMADYPPKPYLKQFNDYLDRIHPKKLMKLKGLVRGNKRVPFLKMNGQYIKPGIARKSDRYRRDIKRLPIQINYFEQIIKYCEAKNIRLYLLMCPIRPAEILNYTNESIEEFRNFVHQYPYPIFLDFSDDKDFSLKDFTDITHLNDTAADRLTIKVDSAIHKP